MRRYRTERRARWRVPPSQPARASPGRHESPKVESISTYTALLEKGAYAAAMVGCSGCHFNDWKGFSANPRIGGQSTAYLALTLHQFRSNARANSPGMSDLARTLDESVGRQDVIVVLLGLLSAIVDNVPLVAASMGMYSLNQYPPDSFLLEFIAYCAGTGGSILIIGSAAGVAAMGLERIQFFWYARRIGLLALVGYLSGAAVYIIQYRLFH